MKYIAILSCAVLLSGVSSFAVVSPSTDGSIYDKEIEFLQKKSQEMKKTIDGKSSFTWANYEEIWNITILNLFNEMTKVIGKMGGKKILGVSLGMGGMDALNQQRVKDVKKEINKVSSSFFEGMKDGLTRDTVKKLHTNVAIIDFARKKIEARRSDYSNTVQIKEALRGILNILDGLCQHAINRFDVSVNT